MFGLPSRSVHRPEYRVSDVALACPDGYELRGASCYRVYSIRRSWPQALAVCSRYGSQLVRMEAADDNAFVGQLAQSHLKSLGLSRYWIGKLELELRFELEFSGPEGQRQARIQDSTTGGAKAQFSTTGGAKAPKSQNFPKIIRVPPYVKTGTSDFGGAMAPLPPLYTGLGRGKRRKSRYHASAVNTPEEGYPPLESCLRSPCSFICALNADVSSGG